MTSLESFPPYIKNWSFHSSFASKTKTIRVISSINSLCQRKCSNWRLQNLENRTVNLRFFTLKITTWFTWKFVFSWESRALWVTRSSDFLSFPSIIFTSEDEIFIVTSLIELCGFVHACVLSNRATKKNRQNPIDESSPLNCTSMDSGLPFNSLLFFFFPHSFKTFHSFLFCRGTCNESLSSTASVRLFIVSTRFHLHSIKKLQFHFCISFYLWRSKTCDYTT